MAVLEPSITKVLLRCFFFFCIDSLLKLLKMASLLDIKARTALIMLLPIIKSDERLTLILETFDESAESAETLLNATKEVAAMVEEANRKQVERLLVEKIRIYTLFKNANPPQEEVTTLTRVLLDMEPPESLKKIKDYNGAQLLVGTL